MGKRCKLIIGGPGTGKTQRLTEILGKEIERGVGPGEIAFLSFTKAAVNEALDRMMRKFKLPRSAFPYCRTIHSFAFQGCGMRREEIMNKKHIGDLRQKLIGVHEDLDPDKFEARPVEKRKQGRDLVSAVLQMNSIAVSHGKTIDESYDPSKDIPFAVVEGVVDAFKKYKRAHCLFDYNDMLTEYLDRGAIAPVRVVIVDEAQDLNELQWAIVNQLRDGADRTYIAGDDDQAIYGFSGAQPHRLRDLGETDREELPFSFRLSPEIWEYAKRTIAANLNRIPKHFTANGERSGLLHYSHLLHAIPIPKSGGTPRKTWMILARAVHLLREYKRTFFKWGVPFTIGKNRSIPFKIARAIHAWDRSKNGVNITGSDADLILKLSGRGPKFTSKPLGYFSKKEIGVIRGEWYNTLIGIEGDLLIHCANAKQFGFDILAVPAIHLDTIHAAKGREADVVVLDSGMTKEVAKNFRRNIEEETRIWYVGATRTRSDLYILNSTHAKKFYKFY